MKRNPVTLPERTVTTLNNGARYVYLTQSVQYHSELKASRPKRICIGKLNDEGLLIPNQNYVDLFGEGEDMIDSSDRCDSLSVGPQFVMGKIAERNGLYELLESVFSREKADRIMDLATYMVVSEKNVLQHFPDYGYDHTLFSLKNFTDTTAGRFLEELKVKDIDLFIQGWVRMNSAKKIYVAYDSTNMNTVAGDIEIAEYGKAKDDDSLPQVNVSVGYSQDDQIPLFYELYPGSLIDNTECEKMVERANRYGCEKIGFILDRGYFSKKNLRFFEKMGYDYIMMTKANVQFVQDVLKKNGPALENGYSYYIESHELYGMSEKINLFGTEKEQYVHLYYNALEAAREKLSFNKILSDMDIALEEKKEKKMVRKEEMKSYEKYYRLRYDDNGYFLNYQRKDKDIKAVMESFGYFAIITSEEMSAAEALDRYRDRDAVEKVFRMDKSYLGNDVFRVHSDEKLEGKVFISFIALILRNNILQKSKELKKINRKEYTVPMIVREIDRLRVTKLSDNRYHLRYNLTAKQKKILKAFEAEEKEYLTFANKVKDLSD
ncbi:MAG: IS1634 family transposase [Erysipelotrichaceae bacterium]|nr:IS1634 family transposase [Erysipelotrichaceae bacterium]